MKPFVSALVALPMFSPTTQAQEHNLGITGKGAKPGLGFADLSTAVEPYESRCRLGTEVAVRRAEFA